MNTAIWIDHERAHILEYHQDGIHHKELKCHGNNNKEQLKKFYHDVASRIESSENVLVLGPGVAKDEFKHHCADHHGKLYQHIRKVEAMKAHPSEEELLATANNFFKTYHSFVGF